MSSKYLQINDQLINYPPPPNSFKCFNIHLDEMGFMNTKIKYKYSETHIQNRTSNPIFHSYSKRIQRPAKKK